MPKHATHPDVVVWVPVGLHPESVHGVQFGQIQRLRFGTKHNHPACRTLTTSLAPPVQIQSRDEYLLSIPHLSSSCRRMCTV